ncbi:MAG TPA: glycosyltransferase [Methanoregulaceae archaeon]|nr:glycosyltransferase [Methanoregulaceae archaeon]
MESADIKSGCARTETGTIGDNPGKREHEVRSRGGDRSHVEGDFLGQSECTLVIPAYNEESRIGALLSGLSCLQFEYIFICDGDDGTASEIKKWGASHPDISLRCIEHTGRIGKGRAVCEGLTLAKTRFAGYMDADGSASCDQMLLLFNELDGNDGIIGSRWIAGAKITRSQGILRRLESRVFNLAIKVLFRLPYKDTQCGAKVFRKEALDVVLPEIVSKGFEFDVELLWRLRGKGFLVSEYPIEWNNRGDSRVKGPDAFSMLYNLVKLRLRRTTDGI